MEAGPAKPARPRAAKLAARRETGGTTVELTATVLRVGRLDRVLLGFGGRWWLTRGFRAVLWSLAEKVDDGS